MKVQLKTNRNFDITAAHNKKIKLTKNNKYNDFNYNIKILREYKENDG